MIAHVVRRDSDWAGDPFDAPNCHNLPLPFTEVMLCDKNLKQTVISQCYCEAELYTVGARAVEIEGLSDLVQRGT